MGRSLCCSKEGLNRGAWTALEDKLLTSYIQAHGEGKWRNLPKRAGLKRCGKSCRLRWLNYLRPDIKRGNISLDEEELIIRLHKLLGNRWSLIAGRLPGRTDNEIKNYWNTTLGKKANAQLSTTPQSKPSKSQQSAKTVTKPSKLQQSAAQVIRTKATRCNKVLIPLPAPPPLPEVHTTNQTANNGQYPPKAFFPNDQDFDFSHYNTSEAQEFQRYQNLNLLNLDCCLDDEFQANNHNGEVPLGDYNYDKDNLSSMLMGSGHYHVSSVPAEEQPLFVDLDASLNNVNLDLDSLAFLLDSDEWPSQNNYK